MRPDPYKIARSRKYLARKKAAAGSKAVNSSLQDNSKHRNALVPRWITQLPSNSHRYVDDLPGDSNEPQTDALDFDILSFSDSNEPPSTIVQQEAVIEQREFNKSAQKAAHYIYEEVTNLDLDRLGATFGNYLVVTHRLPHWFI